VHDRVIAPVVRCQTAQVVRSILVGCLLAACGSDTGAFEHGDVVEVASDGWNFQRKLSKTAFTPKGVNYDHDSAQPCERLLEEYWNEDWASVEGDFEEMARLGFNAVRIHLQLPAFMNGPDAPNEGALSRLDELVELAAKNRLGLLLTGLGNYRPEAVPAWFTALDDDATMAAEAAFWQAVARRYAGEPAILGYDLQNEPVVAGEDIDQVVSDPFVSCDPDEEGPEPERALSYVHFHFRHAGPRWTAWVQGRYPDEAALAAAWADFPSDGETYTEIARPGFFSSAERLRDGNAFKHEMAELWTKTMADAIRAVDPDHMITIGLVPSSLPFEDRLAVESGEGLFYSSFSPYYIGTSLDFVSLHVYPKMYDTGESNIDLSELVLRGAHVGKPVVLEETFPLSGDGLAFLARTPMHAAGWFSFYWGLTPSELNARGDLGSAIRASWIEQYAAFLDGLPKRLSRTAGPQESVSIEALLSSEDARLMLSDRYSAAVAAGGLIDPVLAP
jgi:hypothetical protein